MYTLYHATIRKVDIQRATVDDIDALVDLEDALFENAFGPWTLKKELEASVVYVARDEGAVVAYAIVRIDPALSDLLRLGVRPSAQHKGHGSILLNYVLEEHPEEMMLMVKKDNRRAYSMYRRRGFRVVGTTEASWIMRRAASARTGLPAPTP